MGVQPSVIISQDLSGIGQVSLGVALPLIAAMDFNPFSLPTALLSTHTGGLGKNTFLDLSAQMPAILTHWQTLGLQPDGLLLGYLGHNALAVWQSWLPRFHRVPVRVIDPVMADNGQLYHGFDAAYVKAMRTLVTQATVITPNPTEALLLLDEPLTPAPLTAATAKALAARVAARFEVTVVLTGAPLESGDLGVAGAGPGSPPWCLTTASLAGHYFGTGDIFASVLCGALLRGLGLQAASQLAMTFVSKAISATLAAHRDVRFGVDYAAGLPWLLAQLPS
jgi:pyridoxine kinase